MKPLFLVLADSAEEAQRVTDFVASLALTAGAELVLVHVDPPLVVEPRYGMMMGPAEYLPLRPDPALTEALTQLARQQAVPTEVETCQGPLAEVLPKLLLQYHPQLLVLGFRQEHTWLERLLGNPTLSVLRDAGLPLLLVPTATAALPKKPLQALLAVDSEPFHLRKATNALRPVLHSLGAEFTIVHVSKPTAAVESDMHQALTHVRTSGLLPLGVTGHSYHMQDASCAAGVMRAVGATQADLLLLIVRSRSFWSALFHRSTTAELIRRSTVPLLLLPAEEVPTPVLQPAPRAEENLDDL